ncbi:Metal-dependent hydrolases of the beta-lactamase superfamily I; PhnP protein [Hyphomicrobiales bacterium]|nr:Metal-dependent hydrolases of the beta-lactamase superfamily I; PhnP protein [Hyphomicrobiales bacterium]CAH1663909.1 Metal-dependent hydrolases of the beta-lactamase superfamily I; PhnP protein [Hyphomicrobiales bacterium]
MTTTVTVLGCGSSGGVPRVGGGWGACDPGEPRNRRRRCSVLIERRGSAGTTRVLIDTSPDLREQLLSADVDHLDGVLYTHQHADHTHGIDDLRPLSLRMRRPINVYANRATGEFLRETFGYCFATPLDSEYPPFLIEHSLEAGRATVIEGPGGAITAMPFSMQHGRLEAYGFRIGNFAYATDINHMPEASVAYVMGLDVLILDALRYTPHATHFSVSEALALIDRVTPRQAFLTNLHNDLDYGKLSCELPAGIEPAYDGLSIDIGH